MVATRLSFHRAASGLRAEQASGRVLADPVPTGRDFPGSASRSSRTPGTCPSGLATVLEGGFTSNSCLALLRSRPRAGHSVSFLSGPSAPFDSVRWGREPRPRAQLWGCGSTSSSSASSVKIFQGMERQNLFDGLTQPEKVSCEAELARSLDARPRVSRTVTLTPPTRAPRQAAMRLRVPAASAALDQFIGIRFTWARSRARSGSSAACRRRRSPADHRPLDRWWRRVASIRAPLLRAASG
jgi:hypothetical protein